MCKSYTSNKILIKDLHSNSSFIVFVVKVVAEYILIKMFYLYILYLVLIDIFTKTLKKWF